MAQEIQKLQSVEEDAWQSLKQFTAARIALGRTGTAIPLKEVLQFRLAHAHARDAVYSQLETATLTRELSQFNLPILILNSRATNRNVYLQYPNLGRQLTETSAEQLKKATANFDIAIVLADGLSATAVNNHAIPLLNILIPLLHQHNFSLLPLCIVNQARVAVGDEVGALLNAKMVIVLIGERPGLSSPDSLGAYLTYQPSVGFTDERRNCISNIRTEGLNYQAAAEKIMYLVQASFRLQYSGVQLKDNAGLLE